MQPVQYVYSEKLYKICSQLLYICTSYNCTHSKIRILGVTYLYEEHTKYMTCTKPVHAGVNCTQFVQPAVPE